MKDKFLRFIKNKEVWTIFLKQILFILILTGLFLIDDYIFKIFNSINKATVSSKTLALALGLATGISFIRNKKVIYIFLSVFFVMESIQMVYLAYFGTYLHPTVIPLIIKEIPEITETGFGMFNKVYYAFLAVLIQYFLIFLFIKKFKNKVFSFKFSWIILILFISLLPLRALREVSVAKLLANPSYPSIYNSSRIFSAYFFNILPSSFNINDDQKFEMYRIEKNKPLHDKVNIILVYGEGFNYYNQGLYGYNKDTTPNLSNLAKNDKNFIYKKGIAGAVSTQQSIPVFFNLQREPKNHQMQIEMYANLFKLAKEQDFKTFFISAQSNGLTNSLGRQYVDKFISIEDEEGLFKKMKDEGLLELLKKQKLSDKNFIVLHQRNLHSPYDKNYEHRKSEFNKFQNPYDNAILYNDYLLNKLIEYTKNNTKNPFYIFITSDHNELTGQDGLYGHITLVPRGGDVPIMLYSRDANPIIGNTFKDSFMPTHHELGLLIAKIFGYDIKNPNTPNNIYYINGNDSLARFGYIKVIKDLENQKVSYEMIDTDKIQNKQQKF